MGGGVDWCTILFSHHFNYIRTLSIEFNDIVLLIRKKLYNKFIEKFLIKKIPHP